MAQQALNGKSLLRADALKVTLISGGGRREDYDPEHDSDDMDDDYADTYEVDSYDDMESWRTTSTERLAALCVDGTVAVLSLYERVYAGATHITYKPPRALDSAGTCRATIVRVALACPP